ncbi:hypothetical protein [Agromyces mariniharenae]|uniref:Uncharacterized protein n=1 Tax=Agromyces mariniharenae TaxID=2604423 RepID=A0A5S4V1Q5_9MICO|nr:hypothetical protein [Agromyces mariniharenae]TYL52892.1 hypothetical protein FYC51_03935 [Agromyces mariniharenae]
MKPTVRPAAAAIVAATLLALTGCTLGATPTPSPTAGPSTASPTPTVEPAPIDPLTTVTEIVVRPEHLDLLDAQGAVVTTLSYDADAAAFLGALETVLGATPVPTEYMASMETPARTEYQWDGLMVADDHEEVVSENGLGGYGQIEMNVSVYATAPTVGSGVIVRTVNGYQPGGDAQALAAELGEPWTGNGYDQVRVETGEPIGEQQPYNEYENAYSVAVNTWEWKGASNTILAPWNFGIGHV